MESLIRSQREPYRSSYERSRWTAGRNRSDIVTENPHGDQEDEEAIAIERSGRRVGHGDGRCPRDRADGDPQFAAVLANAYATAYFEHRRDRALDEIVAARETLEQRTADLRDRIAEVEREMRARGLSVTDTVSAGDAPILVAQRDTLLEQLTQVESQLSTIGSGASDLRGGGEILVAATPSSDPAVPRPLRNLTLAIVLGLFAGVGLALLRDHLDDAIRTEDDVRRAVHDVTIVGRLGRWDDEAADQKLITLVDPYAAASEEFQAMATNVRFALVSRADRHEPDPDGGDGQSVAITSSAQAAGKTTVAGNLAVAAAAAGRRVVLVGADLRKPTLASRFGLPEGKGLTDLIADASRLEDASGIDDYLIDVGVPRMRVLTAGSIPPNPTELLASERMAWVHGALERLASLIVYDTPPVLPVADTLELSQHVDLTFLVVRNQVTHRRELAHAVERLEGVGAELGGVVLNGLSSGRGAYGYGYGSEYGYRPQVEHRSRPAETAASSRSDGDVEPEPVTRAVEDDDLDTALFRNHYRTY